MKLQKLTSTVLLSALVLGVASTALAADVSTETVGKGTIQYKENLDPVGPTDPEIPGEVVTPKDDEEIIENTQQGNLQVNLVSNLKFGVVDLTTGKGTYFATPTNLVDKDDTAIERGNYVKVTDKRGDGTFKGWNLTAKITKPFTQATSGSVLKGAEITFMNPWVESEQPEDKRPTAPQAAFTLKSGTDANTATALSAAATTGWGSHTVEYGRPANTGNNPITEATMGKSVQLDVPANTPLSTTEAYVAEITWTIASL